MITAFAGSPDSIARQDWQHFATTTTTRLHSLAESTAVVAAG